MEINKYLEITNLYWNATNKQIKKMIRDAIKYRVKGVCVAPCWVYYAKRKLKNTGIITVTVPNWRFGGGLTNISSAVLDLCEEADEVDYVINPYEMYASQEWDLIERNLKEIQKRYKIKKLIIEASYIYKIKAINLLKDRKRLFRNVLRFAEKYKFNFVKTDSGIIKRDNIESLYDDVRLLRKMTRLPIKASGGIRKREEVAKLLSLGVERIGISQYERIVDG